MGGNGCDHIAADGFNAASFACFGGQITQQSQSSLAQDLLRNLTADS
jgi:hypothetical protein